MTISYCGRLRIGRHDARGTDWISEIGISFGNVIEESLGYRMRGLGSDARSKEIRLGQQLVIKQEHPSITERDRIR